MGTFRKAPHLSPGSLQVLQWCGGEGLVPPQPSPHRGSPSYCSADTSRAGLRSAQDAWKCRGGFSRQLRNPWLEPVPWKPFPKQDSKLSLTISFQSLTLTHSPAPTPPHRHYKECHGGPPVLFHCCTAAETASLLPACVYSCCSTRPRHRPLSQLNPEMWKTYYAQRKMWLWGWCYHHLARILWQGEEGRHESKLKRHTWCFLQKDDFRVLQKVMASQNHLFPSSNRKAVSTLLLHQRQFLGRSLSWRGI